MNRTWGRNDDHGVRSTAGRTRRSEVNPADGCAFACRKHIDQRARSVLSGDQLYLVVVFVYLQRRVMFLSLQDSNL